MNTAKADPKKKAAPSTATSKTPTAAEASKPRTETPEEYASKVLKMEESKYSKYIKAFQTIDDDNSGKVSKSEFREAFTRFNFGTSWSHQSMDEMFDEIDEKKTGYIDVYSFLNKLNKKANPSKNLMSLVKTITSETGNTDTQPDEEGPNLEEEKEKRFKEAWAKKVEQYNTMGPDRYVKEVLNMEASRYKKYSKAFSLMDLNGSGDINKAEFVVVLNTFSLGTNLSREEVNEMFDGIDKGNIGEINLMNFLESLTKENPNKSLLGIISQLTFKANEIEEFKKKKLKTVKKAPVPKKIPLAGVTEKFEESKTPKNTTAKTPKAKTTTDAKTPKAKDIKDTKKATKEPAPKKDAPIKNIYTRREYEKAYRLINRKRKAPLKKKAFVELVQACSLVDDDTEEEQIEELFKTLAKGNDEEMTEEAFIESLSVENPPQSHIDLLEAILSKEQEIEEYNNEKEAEEKQEMYERAFDIINYNPSEPIKKEDFEDVVKGCSLVKAPVEQEMNALFMELDTDKDGEISLEEFLGREEEEKVQTNTQEFVETVLAKEEEILEYKRKRMKERRQGQINKAYELLELDGKGLLKKDEFVDLVKECDVMDEEKEDEEIAKFFEEINKKEAEEMTKSDFIANLNSEEENEEQIRFVELVVSKEEAINEYKRRRKQKVVEEQCRRAFLLLDFYGSQPIKGADFSDIVQGCSLHKEDKDLFKEFDIENSGEMSLEDFTSTICAEESKPHHMQFLETILAKEEEIIEYKKKKAQSDRHNTAKRAFAIIADEGADVLSKEDFEALVRDCSLMPEENDQSKLFIEVDHDKNGELTLEDFLATVGCHDHHHHGRFSKLLDSILENEQIIIEYKRKRAQQERERKAEKVFLLLDFYGSEPIKQPDFIEIITECSLLKKDEGFIAGLFDEIDHAKTKEIPLKEFVRVVGADVSHHAFTELLTNTLANEQAVIEYKRRRARKRREEQCKEAFLLLHYHDTPTIKSDDFVDIVKGCSLVNEGNITADALYKELDLNKDGEMSLEDFTNTISVEDAKGHHIEFLETVLANEEEILEYKKRKAQGERHDSCKKAFAIIVDEGVDFINKEDFDDLVKGCSLLTEEADQDISDLFKEIDHDKNGQMTLEDFIATVGSRDHYHHARFSRLLFSILKNEQVIIEYKRRRAQQAREGKAEKVFLILNFNGKEPIKRDDFIEIITECSVLEQNKEFLSGLFDELDKNKNGEISLNDFVTSIGAHSSNQNFTDLLTNTLNKEQPIEEYKLRRARRIKEEKARKVFLLINFYGTQPIKNEDFIDIVKGCSLHKEDAVTVEHLFKEFNLNNNEGVNLEDFTSSIVAEEPKAHHHHFLDTVLAKEEEIIEYKKKKAQSDRHSSTKRAFAIIVDEGADSINKEDFENLFKECSILADEADLDIAGLFHDIDHDKNGQVTLEDFLATVGSHDHHHHARHSRLLTSIFDNEQVIIEYKRRKAQNARKAKAERVFLLLNFYGNAPIKRQDLVEIITECSIVGDTSAVLSDLNLNQKEEISLTDFVETIGSNLTNQSFTQLLDSAVQKEQEIIEYKRRRAIKIKEEKCRRAFLLLAFYGTQPIKSDDFVDVVKGCSLYKEDITGLFHELDHDKNGEVSQEDFTSSIAVEDSKPHHDEFVETILANEQPINEYKKKKAQSDRHSSTKRAFAIIVDEGADSINKEDFENLFKECSILADEADLDLAALFQDIDHDKNDQLTLEDFLVTVGSHDHHHHARHSRLLTSIFDNEQVIIEYKRRKAQNARKAKAERVFLLLNFYGNAPIKRQDLVDVITECSILPDSSALLGDLNLNQNEEINLKDFVETIGSNLTNQTFSQLLDSAVQKEQEIIEYKRRRAIKIKEEKCRRAFLLLAFYGHQPIKSDDFDDVVKGCSLYKEDITGLFHELDHDKNGEVSQEDFTSSIAVEDSKPHHDEFVETILANEQQINEYKKKKAQSDRHSSTKRAFAILAEEGTDSIEKDDFENLVKECSILADEADLDIAALFHDIDHDKNDQVTLEDFLATVGSHDHHHHERYSRLITSIFDNEQVIIEYKRRRAQNARKAKAERVFLLLNFYGNAPIKRQDLVEIIKGCSILPETSALLSDLNLNQNEEINASDFVEIIGSNLTNQAFTELLDNAIHKEQEINDFKRRRAIKIKEEKCRRAFLLLAFYGTQPIKSDDFVDVVKGCSLYKEDITGLFHELDHDKNGEVSQEDVTSSIAVEDCKPHHDEFVETILANEQQINEYKKKKAQSDRHSSTKRAFAILVEEGANSINKEDFENLFKECSILADEADLDLAGLFQDIDHDKNHQITLEDFLATVGSHDHHHHARYSKLITSILDNEQAIIEYKRRKAQNERKAKVEKVFLLLNFYGNAPIKRQDLVDVITECSILPDSSALLGDLNLNHKEEIDLKDFVEIIGSNMTNQSFTQLLDSAIQKEQEINEYKRRRAIKIKEEKCRRAFLLLAFYGHQPIKSDDFVDVVKGCSLYKEDNVTGLFHELDHDKNGEVSQEDFVSSIAVEDSKPHHDEFVETILANEQQINEYKKKKAQSDRHSSTKRAFAILVEEGADSINKEDFENLFKECSILADEADLDIAGLFHDIDHDKNGQVTLEDFLATVGSHDHHHHARHSRLLTSIFDNEQAIIEYKRRKAQAERQAKAKRVFAILNYHGTTPLRKEDFIELLSECSVLSQDKGSLSGLFDKLDNDKNGEASLEDFLATAGSDLSNKTFTELLESVINKEEQINEHKRRRARKIREEQATRAFSLLNFYGNQPIKSDDFIDIVQGCSLHKEESITIQHLFKELDLDNNAELSLEDFLSTISAEDFKSHHIQFVETVLAHEQPILDYKKKKAAGDRHSSAKRAFAIIVDGTSDSISKEDFEDLFKGCSLMANEADLDISALFSEIDHDKNGQVSLDDFLATVGSHDHHHHARYSKLLASVFDNEQAIIEYKRKRAQKNREAKAKKVFILLSYNDRNAIKREDWIEVITECSILSQNKQQLSSLFDELDADKDGEISFEEFVTTIGSNDSNQNFSELLTSSLGKEQEIIEFKRRRAHRIKEEKCRRAFLIISFYGSQPIKSHDFIDLVKECSLHNDASASVEQLFAELDHDKNGELSLEEFINVINTEDSKHHHNEFLESILANEQQIGEYKRKKAQSDRHSSSKRAFAIIVAEGADSINKKDFEELAKECSLLAGEADLDIASLFNEIDHDKNGHVNLEDFLTTVGSADAHHHHHDRYSKLLEDILNNEQAIIDHKRRKARKEREAKAERVFLLLNFAGDQPISKDDFIEVINGCSIIPGDSHSLPVLFNELDHDKNGQVSLEDFKETLGSRLDDKNLSQLLLNAIEKENEIAAYKAERARKLKQEKCRRVYLLISFNGHQPIRSSDFVHLVKECSLHGDGDSTAATELFQELDVNNSGEITLEGFTSKISSEDSKPHHDQFLDTVLANEQAIIDHKRRKLQKEREDEAQRAFSLLNFNNVNPINRDEFVEIIDGCSLRSDKSQSTADLFVELDHNKDGNISLEDFIATVAAEGDKPSEFRRLILAKEPEIGQFKRKRARHLKEERCRKAFLLLNFHGNQPIKSHDFIDVVKGASLYKGDDTAINGLFKELDGDNNGELSLEDFVSTISADESKSHHNEFLESVLANEQGLLEYKKKKAQADRHRASEKAFSILVDEGVSSVNKEDFEDLVRDCSLLSEEGNIDLSALFNELDHDKNSQLTLSDFLATVGSNDPNRHHYARYSKLLSSILQHEPAIIEYRRRRALKLRQGKAERAFALLNYHGNNPIKKDDLVEIISECALLGQDKQALSNLVDQMDTNSRGEISLEDFVNTVGSDMTNNNFTELLESTLKKEPEIAEHKRRRAKKIREGKARKAFSLLSLHGTELIQSDDFIDIVKECNLHPEDNVTVSELFKELNGSNKNDLSLEDFTVSISADNARAHHTQFVETVLANEEGILEHKKKKAQADRHRSTEKAFEIIADEGADSINREDFEDLLRGCSLYADEAGLHISSLFNEIDHDKNGLITLNDFLATIGSNDHHHHHYPRYSKLLAIINENQPQIIEYKRRRAQKKREGQAERVFLLLNFYENNPIKRDDFVEIITECSLLDQDKQSLLALFDSLNHKKNGEVSLADFIATIGADASNHNFNQLLQSVLDNENKINGFKKRRAHKIKEEQSQKAFLLLNPNDSEPISLKDFTDIVIGCSLYDQQTISNLFSEFDIHHHGHISIDDFVSIMTSQNKPHHDQFLHNILNNEPNILVFKKQAKKNHQTAQSQKAFNILVEKGSNAINKPYFLEIIKALSLIPHEGDSALSDLFHQLDHDKSGDISSTDFVVNLTADYPQSTHSQLLAAILNREQEILDYKAKKAQQEREAQSEKAFLLLNFNGSNPLNREDFAEIVKGCSLSEGDNSNLFTELDQDKNGEVSIQDFLNSTSSENAQPSHVKLVHNVISKEQEIIEFKNNRRRQRQEQCQKAFTLIDVNGQALINKSDFIDLFQSCALLGGAASDVATNIFQQLDKDDSGEINMVEFLADLSSEKADPRHIQLVESILGKEKEILEYRNERLKKDRHGKSYIIVESLTCAAVCEKVFFLLNFFGSKPLQKDDFVDIVSNCSIIEGNNQAITDLFHRLDSDKNGEVSLADFLATVGTDSSDTSNSQLVEGILAKEEEINAYKKQRAQKEREAQCDKAFRLLSLSGTDPLKKDDFIDIVRGCSLFKEENNNTLSQLFHELDLDKNGEVSLVDFLRAINTDKASSHHIQFLRAVLAHEKPIIEYKAKKAREQRQAEAQKAFHILAEKETQPINKVYFEDIVKECGLLTGVNQAGITELFKELDQDKNGDVSLADFTNSFSGENPHARHTQLLASIFANEPKILEYKRRKAQKERQAVSERAYSLISFNGNDPLNKDDFIEIIKGCSLFKERPDFKIINLFEELDVNKDGKISLDEFIQVTSKENPLPHHSQLLNSILSNEQAIAEFKRQRTKANQLNNAKKAFSIVADKGTEPISKPYLKEVIQACSLLKNETDASLSTLFQELDQDKNNEISLADFSTSLTADTVPPKQAQLLAAILAKEPEINKFKAEKARKELQAECEKAFLLLNLYGNEPIKREDFIDIVKGCSLSKEDSNQALSALFQELDKDHNSEVSLADFVGTISADNAQPRYIQFVKTIISKEPEILEYKRKKGLSKRQVQAQKAFNILLEKGSQGVSKPYFLEIVKACSLLPSAHDTIIADVFGQLDHDKNGEISLNDFVTLLSVENPQANHAQLLASILAKEPEIMKYKSLKARREHEALIQKVFLLLSFNGSFPIKKQDFIDVVRGCSLVGDTSSQAISGLFSELDIEKRGEISLQSFQEVIPAEGAQPKHNQFIQTALAKEQEILEFKKNRIRIRQEQSRKAFDLIDLQEQQTISKADFIDLFGACSILEGNSRQEALRLFDVLDKNKSGEVSLREFMNTVNAERADPRHIQLVESIIGKESEIIEYRNKKKNPTKEPTPVEEVIQVTNEIIVERQEPEEVSKASVYHTPIVEKAPVRAENVPIKTSEPVANPQKQRDVTRFIRVFQLINIHGVNAISPAQFEEALGLFSQVGCAFTFDAKKVFNDIDADRDRRINHADFLKYAEDERNHTNSQNLVNEILNKENEIKRLLESRGKKNVVEEEQKSFGTEQKPNKPKKEDNERKQKLMGLIDKLMNNLKDNKAVNPQAKEELYLCIQDLPDSEVNRMPNLARSARVTFLLNVIENYTHQMKLEDHDEVKLENLERVLDEERLLLRKEQERPQSSGGLLNLLCFIPFVTNFHFMFYADR